MSDIDYVMVFHHCKLSNDSFSNVRELGIFSQVDFLAYGAVHIFCDRNQNCTEWLLQLIKNLFKI